MKNLKDQKGITLVALVITIIVLLILAGISLQLVVGDSGILSRATKAADSQRLGGIKDEVELEIANLATQYYQEKYVNPSGTSISNVRAYIVANQANIALSDSAASVTIDNDGTVTLTVTGITGNFTGTIGENGNWISKLNITIS